MQIFEKHACIRVANAGLSKADLPAIFDLNFQQFFPESFLKKYQ